jgi:hypothetical protein
MNKILAIAFATVSVVIAFFLTAYYMDRGALLNPWVQWSSLTLYLGGMFLATWIERTSSTDDYGWQKGLRTSFFVFVFISVGYYIFYYLLFQFIDPGLIDLQRQLMLHAIKEHPEYFGNKTPFQLQNELRAEDFKPSLGKMSLAFAQSLMGGFLLSLLVAFVCRREKYIIGSGKS